MSERLNPGLRTGSFERLGEHVKDALGMGPDEQRMLAQRARLVEVMTQGGAASGSRARLPRSIRSFFSVRGVGLVATLACVVVVSWSVFGPRTQSSNGLAVQLDGEPLVGDSWVTAKASPRELRFSDDSRISLQSNARARIASVDERGLRMMLESGRVEASITEGGPYTWSIAAGPYQVVVLGTVFRVDWSPERHELSVEVARGKVRVTDAENEEVERVLVAGDSLRMTRTEAGLPSPIDSSTEVPTLSPEPRAPVVPIESDSKEEPPSPTLRAPRPVAPIVGTATGKGEKSSLSSPREPVAPAGSLPVQSGGEDWRELAKAGRYDEALTSARQGDVDALIQTASPSDLLLLADSARLSGATKLASRCLLAIRERFPSHANASMAAFSLGRLAAEGQGNPRAAIKWFKTYLRNAPSGSLAEAARGRVLLSYMKLGEVAQAEQAARIYLRLHPSGRHASVARSLLDD